MILSRILANLSRFPDRPGEFRLAGGMSDNDEWKFPEAAGLPDLLVAGFHIKSVVRRH